MARTTRSRWSLPLPRRVAPLIAVALAILVALGYAKKRRAHEDLRPLPFEYVDAGRLQLAAPIAKRIRLQQTADKILGPGHLRIPQGRMAVVISPGPRSSTGYDVAVLSVIEERSRIVVRVREETPGLHDRVRPVVTYPYRVILIPALHKGVLVRWEGR